MTKEHSTTKTTERIFSTPSAEITQDQKRAWFEEKYNVADFPTARLYIERWETLLLEGITCPISQEQREIIIQKFVDFDNMENPDRAKKAAHVSFVKYLFPKTILPAICAIHEHGIQTRDQEALRTASLALIILNDALDVFQPENNDIVNKEDNRIMTLARTSKQTTGFVKKFPDDINLTSELVDMEIAAAEGTSGKSQTLHSLMKIARGVSLECISLNAKKDVKLNPNIPIPSSVQPGNFKDLVATAIAEYIESESGADLPPSFIQDIEQKDGIFLSVDFNSVVTMEESWANTYLIAILTNWIGRLADHYDKKKKIFIVINTGRPAQFAWGVIQSLTPNPCLHSMVIAESGNIIITDVERGTMSVLIENPEQWKQGLDALHSFLSNQVDPFTPLTIEPKKAVLSVKLANQNTPNTQDAQWICRTKDGQTVSPVWINRQIQQFITNGISSLKKDLREIKERPEYRILKDILKQLLETEAENILSATLGPSKLTPQLLEKLTLALKPQQLDLIIRNKETNYSLQTLRLMKRVLVAIYNPTAGFIDVGDRRKNKYSAIVQAMKMVECTPKQFAKVHVGDSKADSLPKINSGPGEENDDVENVLLVGVGNSQEDFRAEVLERAAKGKGLLMCGDSILGLIALIKGLDREIQEINIH